MKKILSTRDHSHIYYETIGSGEPLVFLHGNKQTTNYFKKQIAKFSRHYQLILVNTRDHGKSTNNQPDLNFELLTNDLKDLLLIENLASASFIGFSDGANIALTFACKYPEMINKLVLASPNLNPSDLKSWIYRASKTSLKLTQSLALKKASRVQKLALTALPIKKADLAKLKRPVLVIAGSHDICPPTFFESLSQRLPFGKLLIAKGAGHSVPRLRPKWFNHVVFSFLTEPQIQLN